MWYTIFTSGFCWLRARLTSATTTAAITSREASTPNTTPSREVRARALPTARTRQGRGEGVRVTEEGDRKCRRGIGRGEGEGWKPKRRKRKVRKGREKGMRGRGKEKRRERKLNKCGNKRRKWKGKNNDRKGKGKQKESEGRKAEYD